MIQHIWFFVISVLWLVGLARAVEFRNIGPGGGGTPGCLAVDPSDPKIAYVGLDCGGLHVTTDGGRSWRNANNGIEYTRSTSFCAHNALEVLPSGRALVGNDEGRVFISDDHGRKWKEVLALGSDGTGVIVYDPKDPKTVYAAQSTGFSGNSKAHHVGHLCSQHKEPGNPLATRAGVIYVSHSSGDAGSWKALNTDPKRNLPDDTYVFGLAIDPVDSKLLYAATGYGLYRSRDGGNSWDRIQKEKGLGGNRPRQIVTVPGKANVLYVVLGKSSDRAAGVYRSDDAGDTFSPARAGLPEDGDFFALAVDPINPKVLYLGLFAWNGALHRTLDGGKTWTCLYSAEKAPPGTTGSFHPDPTHVSVGASIRVVPGDRDGDRLSDVVYFIGDNVGQVFKTPNGGKTWEQLITRRKVINGQTFWSGCGDIEFICTTQITVDPSDSKHLWVSNFDWGVLESIDGGESFRTSLGPWVSGELIGPVRRVVLDPDDPKNAFAANGSSPGGSPGGVLMNWHGQGWWIRGGRKAGAHGLPDGSVMGLEIAKWSDNGKPKKYLYATSGVNGVYRLDLLGGEKWQKVSEGLKKEDIGRFLAWAPGTRTMYLTTTTGLFRSDDGQTWKKLTGDGTKYPKLKECIECLVVDPKKPNRIFASLMKSFVEHPDEGVYLSEDGGENWNRIARVPIPYDLSLDATKNHPILYVASQCYGVYKVYQDAGGQWKSKIYGDHCNGLDNTRCWTVTIDPCDPNRLYVGTVGSFVFVSK
jgi:photosystem II stability/assembly factor-like uncharacterized protein